jgi:poly(A) polymerase
MALSRERIADEILKLLGMPDPSNTVAIMLGHDILRPVLPEMQSDFVPGLRSLIEAEKQAGIEPDAIRRLASLLPGDPGLAEDIAVRLRLSNKARKRLACAADRSLGSSSRALAYRVGMDCAADRLLLAGRPQDAAEISLWHRPRLPIGGGALIKRGLPEGPVVARTLRAIEERWLEAGFPSAEKFEAIVEEAVKAAR